MKEKNSVSSSFSDYTDSPAMQKQLYEKTLKTIFFAQAFGGAGLGAGITVGALLAQDMMGTASSAGLPTALFTFGSGIAAFLIGLYAQKYGRRLSLASGFIIGGLGALGIILAAILSNVVLLFLSMFVYGAGMASNLQARYAGTDLANEKQRGTAASIALVSTTIGAVAGPNLVGPMGNVADMLGIPTLAGPFIMSGFAFTIAGLIVLMFLKPDPLLVSLSIAKADQHSPASNATTVNNSMTIHKNGVLYGAVTMILAQLIMTAIMTMTPIHMGHHGHSLNQIGLVIGLHIVAMYLPSPLTGLLIDKFGRKIMTLVSIITFLSAGLIAAFAPTDSLHILIVALVLLGIGWNFGFLTGTALLIGATHISVRAKMQGRVDVLVALSGATGGILSGVAVANYSYSILSITGGLIALLLIPLLFLPEKNRL